ncbi:MAG: single-stranded-DNA-specific exonuclease RecJ [Parcubacteria group bacterium]
MNKIWRVKTAAPSEFMARLTGQHPLVAQLLYNRQLQSQSDIDSFFNPDYSKTHDPFLFKDMARAVERIKKAIVNKEKITIHGDYDADGVTSSAVLYKTFKALGVDVDVFIPHREWDGYGLNVENVQNFVDQGCKLLITVDCGITNVKEIDLLNKNGVDVIITDHHEPVFVKTSTGTPLEVLPNAFAILNAKTKDSGYPFRDLVGVGVAFKLACALLSKLDNQIPPTADSPMAKTRQPDNLDAFLKWLLDLVAIGTVADVASLLGENRTLVKWGLIVLQKTRNLGLQKLLNIIGTKKIDTHTIGYQIAPRLNAAGRMKHAEAAFQLLIAETEEDAERLALDLHKNNQDRQVVMETAIKQAKAQISFEDGHKIIFAFHEEWEPGIIGLIAGKLCDEYYRPAVAMTKSGKSIVGSGRSIEGFNITAGLNAVGDLLERFGGHSQACGFTLLNEGVRENFQALLAEQASTALLNVELAPIVDVDAEIELAQVSWPLIEQLEKFEPFGEGNEQPLFLIKNLTLVSFDVVGSSGQHLRLLTKQNSPSVQRMIWFGSSREFLPLLKVGYNVEAVCEIGSREWNGNRDLEFKVVDLKII